ncbi:hypothetical protein VARIO8X_60518 [Burkholderiales bacterium 8X]|nr:hypothetical protein VARIO8X_60518 [Burkholderiales bacterium 8X]
MIDEAAKFLPPGHVFAFSDARAGILIFHFENAREPKPSYELLLVGTPVPLD